ncbi:hypothetical protein CPB84DRAFT_1677221 [Gymnopilus junonius]|uniref:GST N-terminal domain-containing protein n=1 Tax=Gymnopilus junonius TaxID=109634 RepID=A0A9P5TQ43_GYMJU|nr:hypothetical protein CPB84DRAFT_1677221 [Gymnopilus junonius]
MTIILYDIPSTYKENTFSPNTWKARLALNLKGLPYKTQWVELPDIEPLYKKLGLAPVDENSNGSPFYTIPILHDPATGVYVAESILIAEYLEKTYPDTPSLFPYDTLALQAAFVKASRSLIFAANQFTLPVTLVKLNSSSAEHIRRTREPLFGKTVEEILPTGEQAVVEWAKVQEEFNKIDGWYAKNGGEGSFLLGDTLSWADFVILSILLWLKTIFGEGSGKWKEIAAWNGGRWQKLLEELNQYTTIFI